MSKLEITLTRSIIGAKEDQKNTVKALGLNKVKQTVVREDSPSVRGMINKVSHLVTVNDA